MSLRIREVLLSLAELSIRCKQFEKFNVKMCPFAPKPPETLVSWFSKLRLVSARDSFRVIARHEAFENCKKDGLALRGYSINFVSCSLEANLGRIVVLI